MTTSYCWSLWREPGWYFVARPCESVGIHRCSVVHGADSSTVLLRCDPEQTSTFSEVENWETFSTWSRHCETGKFSVFGNKLGSSQFSMVSHEIPHFPRNIA